MAAPEDKDIAKLFGEKKQEKIPFRCPICDYDEYYPVYDQGNGIIGPGYVSKLTHYVCGGCSVHFNDPKAFTKRLTRIKKKK